MLLNRSAPVFVTGHRGLVGSAVCRRLERAGFTRIVTVTRQELDLTDQAAVRAWFAAERPAYVFHVAGTVGGILANSRRPVEFLRDNLLLHATVLPAAYEAGVKKLLYLGSSCIYPRDCPQPMREEHLLSGPLEPTNEAYALAKIAGIRLCQAYQRQYGAPFIAAMPTNLYGPNDNFDLEDSHVLPALLRKFHEAKLSDSPTVSIWGSGRVRREFLHVDDLADACLFLMEHHDGQDFVNIGTGNDVTIRELAESIRDVVYPGAELVFDATKPDGTPRKWLDVSRLRALGWRHGIELPGGIRRTYAWFEARYPAVRGVSPTPNASLSPSPPA